MAVELEITPSIGGDEIGFALNGLDSDDLIAFTRDLYRELDEDTAGVFAETVAKLAKENDDVADGE